jgi:hypothetical protein
MAAESTSVLAIQQVRNPEPQQVRNPEPVPPSPRLALVNVLAPELGDSRLRPLEVTECSMCGVTHPLGLLVPDGSPACADIRWYCKDVKSCTERWTMALPQRPEDPHGEALAVTSGT